MHYSISFSKKRNLVFVCVVVVLITLIFNRPWTFSIKATANTLYTSDSVNSLVYMYRIIPLLTILMLLIYKDLLRSFSAFKILFKNIYFIAALIYGITSASSALIVYGDFFSIWKSFEFLILIYFFSFVFSCRFNYSESKNIFCFTINTYIIYLLISGVLAFIFPEISFRSKTIQFFSIFPMINPNVMGNLALIVLSSALLRLKKVSFYSLLLASYLFIIFILSISRTAYIAFIFILILLFIKYFIQISFLQKVEKYLALVFVSSVILITLILPVFGGAILDLASRGQSTESLKNLSSRTLIWEASRLSIKERPFFGYGLYAETRRLNKRHPFVFNEGKLKNKGISNTHGTIYEILLASGFLGGGLYIFLFLFVIFRSILYLLLSKPSKYSQFHLSVSLILIIIFFRFTTGSAISGFGIFTLLYFLIISLRLIPGSRHSKRYYNVSG